MRLIGTLNNEELARRFCALLNQKGIQAHYETLSNQQVDLNQPLKEAQFTLWVFNEDEAERAKRMLQEFLETPHRFPVEIAPPPLSPSEPSESSESSEPLNAEPPLPRWAPKGPKSPQKIGPITLYTLMICLWVFVWSAFDSPAIDPEKIPNNLPQMPFYASSIYKTLAYDYPRSDAIIDELLSKYGIEALNNNLPKKAPLPPEAYALIQEYNRTATWNGVYPYLVAALKDKPLPAQKAPPLLAQKAPLFEKIRQKEIWRLVTPIFLHGNLLHLLFNGLWILVLGAQIEERIKTSRYLVLMLLSAALSNTAQYLVSGPNFIGISGVVCAFLAFIWVREKKAPWEGYRIPSSTFKMVLVFIFGMVLLQIIAFISDIYFNSAFSVGIANTAHLVGGLSGYILAHLPFFNRREHAR